MTTPQKALIVIVSHNRSELLSRCLQSCLQAQSHLSFLDIEVAVYLNPFEKKSEEAFLKWQAKAPHPEKWMLTQGTRPLPPPEARNQLSSRYPQRDLYIFIDDDAYFESSYFQELERLLLKFPHFALMGGPNLCPPDAGSFERNYDQFLSSLWAGPFRWRYKEGVEGAVSNDHSLILCNLVVRGAVLKSFSRRFPVGEENDLVQSLLQEGAKAFYSPQLRVFHSRRDNLKQFQEQIFRYGEGRGYVMRSRPTLWFVGVVLLFPLSLLGNLFCLPFSLLASTQVHRRVHRLWSLFLALWAVPLYLGGILWGYTHFHNEDDV